MCFVNVKSINKYTIGIQMKKRWLSSFVWMVDVIHEGVWVLHYINKDEGNKSLPLLAFRGDVANTIFLKYSKEGRLYSSHVERGKNHCS